MKRSILFCLFVIAIFNSITAQVTSINYLMEYNESTSFYDVKLVINSGSATTFPQRVQFNSQISIVVPTGASIEIAQLFNPLLDNQTNSGTIPCEWMIGASEIAPPVQPENDFYSITPTLDPIVAYNNLSPGDTVPLFNLDINVDPCDNTVRLFENGVDPSSTELPSPSDYSNGFTLGGINQIYSGNSPSTYTGNFSVSLLDHIFCVGECIELMPILECAPDDLTYAWSTGESTPIITVCPDEDMTFTVEVSAPNISPQGASSVVDIVDVPVVSISGPSEICANGGITFLSPTTGGTWMSSNPSIATVTNGGEVTGIFAGTAFLTFTDASNGCTSDVIEITVIPVPEVSITGSDSICVNGTTTLSPSTGGTWVSSNPVVATVDNLGNVTGVSVGHAVFTFTDLVNGCQSLVTDTIWVIESPVVEITGDDRICIGETSTVSPNSGGTWVANNNPNFTVATIDANTGIITGVGQGAVNFTFTDATTGCTATTLSLIVDPVPSVSTSDITICITSTTTLSPSIGGTWEALNPTIASLIGTTVTGQSSGEAGFLFTANATGCVSDTLFINVDAGPITTLTGPNQICIGESTTIEPTTGGTWSSDNLSVATIDNFGNITGVGQGIAKFTFTSAMNLCASEPSEPIVVYEAPFALASLTGMCILDTMNVLPSSGGTWVSNDPTIASVEPSTGLVTALSAGNTTFTFTDDNTGCFATTEEVTVIASPEVEFTALDEICVGFTTAVSPTSGGTWTSDPPLVATVDNLGNVTGITAGIAQLIFYDNNTGCSSEPLTVTVHAAPPVSIAGDDELCIGETSNLSPTVGGTWTSSDFSVATVDNFGTVTAISPGQATFTFTSAGMGQCSSQETDPITVNGSETIVLDDNELCIGETTFASTTASGTWVSNTPGVATINPSTGEITAVSAGATTFYFTNSVTSCVSNESEDLIVYPTPEVSIVGPEEICLGETSQLFPSGGGVWTSDNPSIASVDDNGLVTANALEGSVFFTWTENISGCTSDASDPITIIQCQTITTSCEDINPNNLFCDFAQLGSSTGSLNTEISTGNQPSGILCANGDEAGNIVWLGFFAAEGDYDIVINSSSCIPFAGGISGMQVGIYSDCNFDASDPIVCEVSNQVENEIIISSDLLTAGEVYYMYIDGIDNSICDFNIEIRGDYDDTFCSEPAKVTGTAYVDKNENGVFDTDETPLRNVLISLFPGDFSVLTNDQGKYSINTPKGEATMTASVSVGDWKDDLLTLDGVAVLEACIEDIDFGFIPELNSNISATLTVANTIVRCDWETKFYITVENTGTEDFNGLLAFEFDDRATFFASTIADYMISGNIITAETGELLPFVPQLYEVTLKNPSGSTNLPMLDFKATLLDLNEAEIVDYTYAEQLRCSYDPNDKREYPDRVGAENLTLMDEDIEYTIRFQNNGNDTAFLVKIVDVLDPNIDPRSIRVMNSSHDVETCIDGNILTFLFEDINLVDSMTNYEASQGFVTFRSKSIDGVAEFTPVHNTADIIFDTNMPIITNTTINTLVSVLCTDTTVELDIDICEGDTYEGYEESGTYTNTITSLFGCDSTVIINLEVQGITYFNEDIQSCEGGSIEVNGTTYILNESQEIIDTVFNFNDCITNIMSFDVTVIPTQVIEIDTTICEGMDYNGLVESGMYTFDSIDIITGCDIITMVDLDVLPLSDPSCIVGTKDLIQSEVKVFPNPARDIIYIESESNMESIMIYSMDFQKIIENPLFGNTNKTQISIDDFNQGLYLIVIKTGGRVEYKKLIVE